MESRMEKYHEIDIEQFQRSKRNAQLYKKVYGDYSDFEDLPIPENTNEIDLENLKTLMESQNKEKQVQIEKSDLDNVQLPKAEKVYDINTLLEKAKEENAKIKKEVPVNRNIPNYLANLESDKNTMEIILRHDEDNDIDMPIVKEAQYLTAEINFDNKTINTTSLSLDILSDLKPTGDTMVSEPIIDSTVNLEEEKDFFDKNSNFQQEDFEDNEEELFYEEKSYTFLKVILIIIGLAIILAVTYFAIKEYTNIF